MDEMLESKLGKYFVIAYALATLVVYAIAFFCGSSTCSLYIIFPIMPWASILVGELGVSFPWMMYPVFVLLNASVAYAIGATIEWVRNRYLDHKEASKLRDMNRGDVTTHRKT